MWAGLAFVWMMAASGCGGADEPASGDPGAGSEPRDSSISPATTEEESALTDIVVVRDQAAAVEAMIGIEGGSLEAVGGDGAVWRLDVPRGALAADTMIRAVPAILEGVDVPSWTLMFEPSGLFFYEFATLTIATPVEVPIENQFAFSLDDEGSALGAAPIVVDSATPTLLVGHFSGYGLAQATPPERAALLERRAADADARIQSQLGEAIGELRQAAFSGEDEPFDFRELVTMAFEEFERDVLKPRLEAAGASCEATQRAVQTAIGYARQRLLLGFETSTNLPGIMELINSDVQPGGKCEEEAIRQCIEAEDPSILIEFWLGAERQRQLLGGDSTSSVDDVISRAKQICAPTTYAASGGGAEVTVTGLVSDLELPFSLEGTFPGGSVTFSYLPDDDRSGTHNGALSGAGVTGSVSGTYTITGDVDGPLTLTQQSSGCIDGVPNSCRDTTEVITLTPTE